MSDKTLPSGYCIIYNGENDDLCITRKFCLYECQKQLISLGYTLLEIAFVSGGSDEVFIRLEKGEE